VSDYAWICAELLGAEHTQIAYPGICLSSGYPGAGMDKQYLKQQSPDYSSSPNWDFSKYSPTIVVCNLGVNDENKNVPDATFKNNYFNLLKNIRAKFPNAQIFVVRTFTGAKATSTLATVNAMIATNDNKIHFVNTSGWLSDDDYYDGIHPNLSGQIKAASLLKKVLAPYML
jgi:lysophospholipase L1-like esterase